MQKTVGVGSVGAFWILILDEEEEEVICLLNCIKFIGFDPPAIFRPHVIQYTLLYNSVPFEI